MLDGIERKLGLPRLREVSDMLTEDKLKQLNSLLTRLEKFSKNLTMLAEFKEILKLLNELEDKGVITRLNLLLEELGPIVKSKTATKLVSKLDKIEKLVQTLLTEEKR